MGSHVTGSDYAVRPRIVIPLTLTTTMPASVADLIYILDVFFPSNMSMLHALTVLLSLAALYPILRLHQHQLLEPRQPRMTAWKTSVLAYVQDLFNPAYINTELTDSEDGEDDSPYDQFARYIHQDIDVIMELMGVDVLSSEHEDFSHKVKPHRILCTKRLECSFCPPTPNRPHHYLRRRVEPKSVRIFRHNFQWETAFLVIAHCITCRADFYPDRYTYMDNTSQQRMQKLEYDTDYLRISKSGIWSDRQVARIQESAVLEFRAGWSNFANWVNRSLGNTKPHWTARQSQRLFVEHFSRRLLLAHGHTQAFTTTANRTSHDLASSVRDRIGKDGGVIIDSLHHGCIDCTHRKRYRVDLVAEGAVLLDNAQQTVEEVHADEVSPCIEVLIYLLTLD